ncbi:Inosine-5'-monophosphate dehydrogenase [Sesamum angolense]|uniref:Inosine-5'-monophosphate dehydrogenase n=1 Tax=Sesamum angolense TaxID=2727404 RepID=A0AAE2BHS6_9LAMI|nr:Inosine-5'-monophosphate dehydrogenase [Sesamum angolense]
MSSHCSVTTAMDGVAMDGAPPVLDDGFSASRLFIQGYSYTYDDVIFLPHYIDFPTDAVSLSTKLKLSRASRSSLHASPLPWTLRNNGEEGEEIVNLVASDDVERIQGFPKLGLPSVGSDGNFLVGAAIGTRESDKERLGYLVKAGVNVVVLDSSHGNSIYQIEMIKTMFGLGFGPFPKWAPNPSLIEVNDMPLAQPVPAASLNHCEAFFPLFAAKVPVVIGEDLHCSERWSSASCFMPRIRSPSDARFAS